jgi:hypothetical protein
VASAAWPAYNQRVRRSIRSSPTIHIHGPTIATAIAIHFRLAWAQSTTVAVLTTATPSGLVGTGGTALLLRALAAQRRARVQARAARSAKTEHTHAMRRDVAMDRWPDVELEIHERRRERGSVSPELPGPETCKKTAKELPKKPHSKLGTSHAGAASSPIARGNQIGDEIADSDVHGSCRTLATNPIHQKPIRSRTAAIVSRANVRHRSAPRANASSISRG